MIYDNGERLDNPGLSNRLNSARVGSHTAVIGQCAAVARPTRMSEPTDTRSVFLRLDRSPRVNYTRSEYVRRVLWRLVQGTLYRLPLPRGHAWRCFLLRCFGAKMGRPTGVYASTRIMHPWLLETGAWSMLGPQTTVYNLGPVKIGEHTVISQDVYLCAGTHDYTRPELPLQKPAITIGAGVWIAAGAFIGPGVAIGDNCVIGAHAVVVKEVPPGVVAAGNPARIIKPRPMNTPPS
jgi:putative colanic acid biosynthesis acetyltransferase WcaF